MSKIDPAELILQQDSRAFVQWGGPRPNNPAYFAGQGSQYMFIDGVENPVSGDVTPIRVPHPRIRGQYKLVARSKAAPDIASATLTVHEKHGAIPRQLMNLPCPFNFYEYTGKCSNLSDKAAGFDDYVLVYSSAEVNSNSLGTRTARDSNDPMTASQGISLGSVYPVGRLAFGEKAAASIDAEVRDIVYGTSFQCGDCGTTNDGTLWAYGVYDGISASTSKARVIYTLNGGDSWTSQDISSAASGDIPVSINVIGDLLVVVIKGSSASEIHWSTINSKTGAPSASWTKVTTGFTTKLANDLYAPLSSSIFIAADDGIIYVASAVTAGVTALSALGNGSDDFNRISGDGSQTIVAVGDNAMVYKSTNGGQSWVATTTNPGAAELSAVCVMDENRFWVGNTSGAVYYTLDGGETWTQDTTAAPSATAVQDIVAATDEVLYVSYQVTGPSPRLSTTWNGGETWTQRSPRIGTLPSYVKGNRIALPTTENPAIDSNDILIAALDFGTEGSIVQGSAAVL